MAKRNDETKALATTITIIFAAIFFIIKGFISLISFIFKPFTKKQKKPKEDNKGLATGIALAALLNNDDKVDKELEKEMNAQNLEDWQKDLVREGKYSPYNFDEEELEEDDYYYEDD